MFLFIIIYSVSFLNIEIIILYPPPPPQTPPQPSQVRIYVKSGSFSVVLPTVVTRLATSLNPFMPNGLSRTYQLDQSISVTSGCWMVFFIFIQFLIEYPGSKQWTPRSDAALCGV